jgi:hypothetical protein
LRYPCSGEVFVNEDTDPRASARPDPSERPGRRLGVRSAASIGAGAALVGLVLVAAGCGRTTAPPVATVSTTNAAAAAGPPPSNDPMAQAVRYAACIRSHGLPNFPDPQQSSQDGHQTIRIHTPDLNSGQAQAAEKACSKFLPSGFDSSPAQAAQTLTHLLAFARCMRDHGVPGFPDPTSTGSFPTSIQRIDRLTPVFRSAATTCLPVAAGAISLGTSHAGAH